MKKLFAVFALIFIADITLLFSEPKYSSSLESLPKIICRDNDWEKPIRDWTMHLEVYKNGKLIQNLEYEFYEDELSKIEGLKKHFELIDLNFDGYDDILIHGGYTRVGADPFYDAFFWNEEKIKFEYEPEFWDEICHIKLKCDSINQLLYAEEYSIAGIITYFIYEFSNGGYREKAKLFYNLETNLYSEEFHWNFENDDVEWFPYEKVPEYWKKTNKL